MMNCFKLQLVPALLSLSCVAFAEDFKLTSVPLTVRESQVLEQMAAARTIRSDELGFSLYREGMKDIAKGVLPAPAPTVQRLQPSAKAAPSVKVKDGAKIAFAGDYFMEHANVPGYFVSQVMRGLEVAGVRNAKKVSAWARGEQTGKLSERMVKLAAGDADWIVFCGGLDDAFCKPAVSPEDSRRNLARAFDAFASSHKNVLVMTLPFRHGKPLQDLDDIVRTEATKRGLPLVDLAKAFGDAHYLYGYANHESSPVVAQLLLEQMGVGGDIAARVADETQQTPGIASVVLRLPPAEAEAASRRKVSPRDLIVARLKSEPIRKDRIAVLCGIDDSRTDGKWLDLSSSSKLPPEPSPAWISGDTADPAKPAPVLMREFVLDDVPSKATLGLAVAGWHEVTVNGRRIGNAVLSPVTCQPDARHSSVVHDISGCLRRGTNTVEVLLGNGWFNCFTKGAWGFETARWLAAPQICGRCEADGRTLFVTDESWKAYDSPIVFNGLRNGEWYDARREGQRPNLRAAKVEFYAPTTAVSPEDAAPCRAFDPIPPVRDFAGADGSRIYDFGSNRAGWCEIEVLGEVGAKVTLDYDELLSKDGKDLLGKVNFFQTRGKDPRPGQHDEYTLAGRAEGERWHPRFTYHGFRYVRVKTTGKVALKEIRSVFAHSDFRAVGSFAISDPTFAKLQDAMRRSYLSNFVGIPTDCPHREKNGWTGDTQLAMETGLWNFDARDGYRHFLRMILDAQRPNGAVPCIAPASDRFGFGWGSGPAWDAILFEIPEQLYRFYGDDSAAREAYPAMKKYLAFIATKRRADGLVAYGLGDWCPPQGFRIVSNLFTDSAYVYEFNRRTALWADRFGDTGTAARCRAEAARIRKAFNREFYKGKGVYAEGQITALAAPLYFPGLVADGAEQATAEELVKRVREKGHQAWFGILGAKWVPRVLAAHGYIDDAYRMFVQPSYPGWAKWVADGEDSLWEDWEGGNSHNHIMYGDFSAWAYEYLAGIKCVSPGFAEVAVKPHLPEGVASFEVSFRTARGETIHVTAGRDSSGRPVYKSTRKNDIIRPND